MAANLPQKRKSNRHVVSAEVSKKPGLLIAIGHAVRSSYNPKPLAKPVVDRQLTQLPALLRISEVCRYSLAKLEYSLSSGGGLRAWFKLNLLIALIIATPALLVMPVITLILGNFATWSEYLEATAINLFWTTVYVILTAVLITVALFVFGALNAAFRRQTRD